MKRKFLSSMMFGALVVASASLTSCKDYDDDINNLKTEVEALKKTVADIQKLIDSGSVITNVESVTNGVKITLSNKQSYTITNGTNGTNGADGKAGSVVTIGEDGVWYIDGVSTGLNAQGPKGDKGDKGDAGENGAAGKDGQTIYYLPNAETGKFDKVTVAADGTETTEETDVKFLAPGTITATQTADALELYNVKGAEKDPVVISLKSDLKALVADPDFYYQGIEAFDLATFNYTSKTLKDVSADADNSADAPVAGEATVTSPALAVTYFLNPSNAKVDSIAENYKFIAYNKNYTRAGEDISKAFTVKSATLKNAGKVTVTASYNGAAIKSIATDNQVTTLALQYTKDGVTVTSDYAALRANTYTDLEIRKVTGTGQVGDLLQLNAATAIAKDAQAEVAYNSTVDLRTLVHSVRTAQGGAASNWDENAGDGKVAADGFSYKFELVGYTSGDNKTSQSAHAAIAADGYTLHPQDPTESGKQQAYGASQSRSIIDKQPLVRISLTDNNSGKVVAVSYLKLKITDAAAVPVDPTEITYSATTATDAYTIACNASDAVLTQSLSWSEVEARLYRAVELSKTEFEDNYTLEGGVADATQYELKDGKFVEKTTKFGVVSQTTSDVPGSETQVLKWTVKQSEATNAFAKATSADTYVRFTKSAGKAGKYDYYYVKFTWTPSAINNKPAVAINDAADKVSSYWFAANSDKKGSGFAEVHANIDVVKQTGAAAEYSYELQNAFVATGLAGQIKAALPKAYQNDALTSTLAVKYHFVSGHGLFASADGLKVYADEKMTEEVASIDETTGKLTLATTDKAKELLNAASHSDLANTLTTRVAIIATLCGNVDVALTNNEFDVKWLRPVNITGATAEVTDGVTGGSDVTLNLTFTDWRDINFDTEAGDGFYTYYEISAITPDLANATVMHNGKEAKLTDVFKKIELTALPFTGTVSKDNKPKVHYQNNGAVTSGFEVKIPATVTYKWGTLSTTITLTVKGTQGNVSSVRR